MTDNQPMVLSVQAAAKVLGVSYTTMRRLLASPDGPPAIMVGGRPMILTDALTDWVAARPRLPPRVIVKRGITSRID